MCSACAVGAQVSHKPLGGATSWTIPPSAVDPRIRGGNAVAVFAREPATGMLTFVEAERNGIAGVEGLGAVAAVGIHPGGTHVYATGVDDGTLVVLARDPVLGTLRPVQVLRDNHGGVDGLSGIASSKPW